MLGVRYYGYYNQQIFTHVCVSNIVNFEIFKIVVPKLDVPSTTQKRHVPDPQQFPFRQDLKYYCQRSIIHETDCLNTNDLECSVTFTVDKNICVIGVQVIYTFAYLFVI